MPLVGHCGHLFFYLAMKRKLMIIAVLVISLVASYILCDTKPNNADIDSVKVEEYTAILENSID